ncbi:MAG: 2Fe-2S iron-sulfur cluster-binding protein, partial [Paracoccaceae bacterium]
YEIWKSDSQKCATYRITTEGGAMCGRCMKTCPWNLEGLFSEAPFRWAASNIPKLAQPLAKLDDMVGRGGLNDVKKWWWDIELYEDGGYKPARKPINRRNLSKNLDVQYKDQTLAVYPAHLAPHPWPYPFPMDREKGIAAYEAMITAEEYRKQIVDGHLDPPHKYSASGQSPVVRVEVSRVEKMTEDITKYEFKSLDGSALPEWSAGAHLDVLVAPEFLRQYSMSGDPANREVYQIGVLKEETGLGGSKTMHRIFTPGRKVFISKPINHFELDETASKTFLMGGGIGITPMIAFAHRLYALNKEFELHYSSSHSGAAGYLSDLAAAPWANRVHYHFSQEGNRADFAKILRGYEQGWHVYLCGPHRYMEGVVSAAEAVGFPEDTVHLEYFSTPDVPDYENHDFILRLEKSGKEIFVPADKDAATVLAEHGYAVDLKCSDGICGVCQCRVLEGEVEHRDFVLSQKQRQTTMILCQSRAAQKGGILTVDI